MSATSQNDRVNFLTLQDYNSTVVDAVNRSSEIMKRVVSRPERWNGRSFSWAMTMQNSQLGKSFKGVETFDTSIDFSPAQATVFPTGYAQPVGISVVERSINATPAGKVDLYRASYQFAQNSMITDLGNIFYGFGNGNDFDGLGLIVDDGTSTASYAGLTRSQYPQINAYVSTPSQGKLTLGVMGAADDAATISGDLSESPNVLLTTRAVWTLYESLLTPTVNSYYQGEGGTFIDGSTAVKQSVRQSDSLYLKGGANSLTYRGKPVVRDDKAPAGSMFGINENWFHFKSLKIDGLDMVATQNDVTVGAYGAPGDSYRVSAFQFRKPIMPVNQLAEVGIFVMYGQFYCENPNRNFRLNGITGV